MKSLCLKLGLSLALVAGLSSCGGDDESGEASSVTPNPQPIGFSTDTVPSSITFDSVTTFDLDIGVMNNERISQFGRYLAYIGDDQCPYVFDVVTQTNTQISENCPALMLDISHDGRYVLFLRSQNGRELVERYDQNTKTTDLFLDASVPQARFSPDGSLVAFTSRESLGVVPTENLLPGQLDTHTFVINVGTGQITPVSVSSAGIYANGSSGNPQISADNRFVIFDSGASNIHPTLRPDRFGRLNVVFPGETESTRIQSIVYLHELNSSETKALQVVGAKNRNFGISNDGANAVAISEIAAPEGSFLNFDDARLTLHEPDLTSILVQRSNGAAADLGPDGILGISSDFSTVLYLEAGDTDSDYNFSLLNIIDGRNRSNSTRAQYRNFYLTEDARHVLALEATGTGDLAVIPVPQP